MIWRGDKKSKISFDETLLRMRVVVRPELTALISRNL